MIIRNISLLLFYKSVNGKNLLNRAPSDGAISKLCKLTPSCHNMHIAYCIRVSNKWFTFILQWKSNGKTPSSRLKLTNFFQVTKPRNVQTIANIPWHFVKGINWMGCVLTKTILMAMRNIFVIRHVVHHVQVSVIFLPFSFLLS